MNKKLCILRYRFVKKSTQLWLMIFSKDVFLNSLKYIYIQLRKFTHSNFLISMINILMFKKIYSYSIKYIYTLCKIFTVNENYFYSILSFLCSIIKITHQISIVSNELSKILFYGGPQVSQQIPELYDEYQNSTALHNSTAIQNSTTSTRTPLHYRIPRYYRFPEHNISAVKLCSAVEFCSAL